MWWQLRQSLNWLRDHWGLNMLPLLRLGSKNLLLLQLLLLIQTSLRRILLRHPFTPHEWILLIIQSALHQWRFQNWHRDLILWISIQRTWKLSLLIILWGVINRPEQILFDCRRLVVILITCEEVLAVNCLVDERVMVCSLVLIWTTVVEVNVCVLNVVV